MRLEAFTAAKDPRHPERNEDRLVVHGGALFVVLDGVTDKSGRAYGGQRGGRIAGRVLDGELRRIADEDAHWTLPTDELITRLNASMQAAYRHHRIEREVEADPNLRFSAAVAIAFVAEDRLRLTVVGDAGVRVNGNEVLQHRHPLDEVLSRLRALVFTSLRDVVADDDERLAAARSYTVEGIDAVPAEWRARIDLGHHHRLAGDVMERLPALAPHVEPELAREIAREGLRGGVRHRNRPGPVGHGVLDGFPLPLGFVIDRWIERAPVHTLELFSDGYFGAPRESGSVAAWEARHALLEREDPHRFHLAPSTKGSSSRAVADDRTVLVVKGISQLP